MMTIGHNKSIGRARLQPLAKARIMPEKAMPIEWRSAPYLFPIPYSMAVHSAEMRDAISV